MLRSMKALFGYTIRATDGEIGKVADFYFDDHTWTIRYLIVETGSWFSQHQVLLAPQALEQPRWSEQEMPVNLTKEEVENSPTIDLEKPVSRQHELALHEYYGWGPYWAPLSTPTIHTPTVYGPIDPSVPPRVARRPRTDRPAEQQTVQTDPHLRSMEEVMGYDIQARDGEIGHVEDFISDDQRWRIQYLVVDTRDWLPGKQVLLALEWIKDIDWVEHDVRVDLQRETIQNSPEYDPATPINRAYEGVLYDYYGRPAYWETG